MSSSLNEIEKRADNYTQMDVIPDVMAAKIPAHYITDVPVLLAEIQRLQQAEKRYFRIINAQNETLDNLKADCEKLYKMLKNVQKKYNWHKDVFSPPRIVKDRKTRVTDNRTPMGKQ